LLASGCGAAGGQDYPIFWK